VTPGHAHLLALSPPGRAFPREEGAAWPALLEPLAEQFAALQDGAEALLREVDPRAADALLPDYERVLGDDPCLGPSSTLPFGIRQALAHQRWTSRGGATPAFFVAVAAAIGVAITITESAPFECGVSQAGDELVREDGRFEWFVNLPATTLVEFEAGASEAGSPLGDFIPSPVECLLRRHAPAHTTVYFNYGS